MIATDLITAYYERLTGADAHEQTLTVSEEVIPVFTGNASTAASAPYVIVSRPRVRGGETLDGVSRDEVRIQLRVHTEHPHGKGNHFQAYEIAEAAHGLLESAPITVDGREPYVPEPDISPIPSYEKGDREALDLSLDYRYPSI